jgi:hypothetical protein
MRTKLIKIFKNPYFIWLLSLCSAVFVSTVYGIIFQRQAYGFLKSDLLPHLATVTTIVSHPTSYPLFPFSALVISKFFRSDLVSSAIVVLMFSVILSAIILGVVLKKKLKGQFSWPLIGLLICSLMSVSAIYLPGFSKQFYLSTGSPNTIHNPTLIFSKPFAFISIYLFCRLSCAKKESINILAMASSFFIILGALAKPNFGLAFLFSGPLFLILRRDIFRCDIQNIMALAFPLISLVLVLGIQYYWQYFSRSVSGASIEDGIIVDFWGVARLFSPNPFVSLLLLAAFPFMTVIFYPSILKDSLFALTLLTFLVSVAQFWVFAESGSRYPHGNFGWALEVVVPMLFVICMAEVINRFQCIKTKADLFKIWVMAFIFAAHLVSGLLYFKQLMTTDSYF